MGLLFFIPVIILTGHLGTSYKVFHEQGNYKPKKVIKKYKCIRKMKYPLLKIKPRCRNIGTFG
jgi:hypothetical protein